MSPDVADYWGRAQKALESAGRLAATDPDGAASRAYYAAFYAASALFAAEGRFFTKHSAVTQAVHRDLVQSGRWSKELGESYSFLVSLRSTGDYGGEHHVSREDADTAIHLTGRIIDAVRTSLPTSDHE